MLENSLDLAALDGTVLCWPGEREAALRGWSLRTGTSPALRANSAFPFASDADTSEETLGLLEVFFRERARIPAFRITPFGPCVELDQRLAEADYSLAEPTLVMTASLGSSSSDLTGSELVGADEDWLDLLGLVASQPPRIRAHYGVVLPRAPRDRVRVAVESEGRVVAVALGLITDGWLGLFDVVTAPDHRGRGHARRAIRRVHAEARARGVERAFLYTTEDNDRAIGLYTGLGYREAYAYHYRVLR
ncbi:MAG: GNAT family N-acetyltransferase [Planctomycetota bacterium]